MIAPAQKIDAPAAAAPEREEPLLLVDVVAPAPNDFDREGDAIERLAWGAAALALMAPGVQLLLPGATASGLMWVVMVFGVAGIAAAERFRWAPAAWFVAAGATGWSFVAIERAIIAEEGGWPALFLVVLALAGLWRMRRAPAQGAVLIAGVGAVAVYGAFAGAAASPYGAAIAAITVCAAIAGGALRRLEPALGLAWLLGCGGLLALSGQPAAQPWLVPAFVLFAALFVAIEALTLPVLKRGGLMIAAIGAISPLMAAGALYGAGLGFGGRAGEALAFLATGALQAGVLMLARRKLGDLKALGIAIAPVGVAIVCALIAAAAIWLGEMWSAAALGALALGFARLHGRAPHRMWAAAAILIMLAAAVQAARATGLLVVGDDGHGVVGAAALAFVAVSLAVPGLAAALAARNGPTAPILNATFEAFAIVFGFAALVGAVRFIATGAAPGAPLIGFAEAGAHASAWIGAGLLVLLCPDRGAQTVRRTAAALFFALAAFLLIGGAGWRLNPWWGAEPAPASGWPIVNTLFFGYAAPALMLSAFVWLARRRAAHKFAVLALAVAGACALVWIALELRRAFHGPDLAGGGVMAAENVALSALLFVAALGLRASRRLLDPTERLCAAALAAAILLKVGFIDLYQPTDGWRVASLVILAFAGAALALPRARRTPHVRPNPALWEVFHRLGAGM